MGCGNSALERAAELKPFSLEGFEGPCYMSRIIDGDTFELVFEISSDQLKNVLIVKKRSKIYLKQKCRLAHIDVYEKDTEMGKKAIQYLASKDKFWHCKCLKPDKYGRTLVELSQGKHDLATVFVSLSYGYPYEGGKKILVPLK